MSCWLGVLIIQLATRSTQRAQTSLTEADHYSHIAHCKNIEPWWWKTTPSPQKKEVLDHYLHHYLGMLPLLWCFVAHLLILEYPNHHQNWISSSLYYPGPLHKISSQSVHNFLSNVVHRQTDRQTDRQTNKQTNATKNITSFAKEVINTFLCTRKLYSFSHLEIFICIYRPSVRGEIDQISTNTFRYTTCCAANVYMFPYILTGAPIVPLTWTNWLYPGAWKKSTLWTKLKILQIW